MNFRFSILVLFISLVACKSKVDRLLMSNDTALKEQKAQEYFENCDYVRASPLFKDLIQSYSSSAKVEKVYFYYSYCDYLLEDYLLAAYEFQKILKKFPRGKYAEQSQFLLADCFYKSTPKYNLDQDYNLKATEEFQLFLDRFPNSEKRAEANQKIDELYSKRERKAYEAALLYHRMENYRSSMSAFSQVLTDFPDIAEDEKVRYLMVEAAFKFSEKSIEGKKMERFSEVSTYAKQYFKRYPDKEKAQYYEDVESLEEKAKEKIEALKKELPSFYLKKKRYNEATALLEDNLKREKSEETRSEYADLLLESQFRKGIGSDDNLKQGVIDTFLMSFNQKKGALNPHDLEKWNKKVEYATGIKSEMFKTIPYSLESSGEYEKATQHFEKWMDTINLNIASNHSHFYFYLTTKNRAAKNALEIPAKEHWEGILRRVETNMGWESGEFKSKIESLIKEVKAELAKYPLELIKAPMDRKDYSLAYSRALEVDKKKDLQNQEEVVYLLLLSSVKKAKSVSKYERLPLYEQTKALIEKRRSEVQDAKLSAKIDKLHKKAIKKIKKYENN